MAEKPIVGAGKASRAWEYHHAADTTLHTRVNAMLVCQSFLIAAYVTLTVNSGVRYGAMLGIAIIGLAAAITVMFMVANIRLLRGITYLKRQIVAEPDHLYGTYLHAVHPRQLDGRGGSRTLALQLPVALLIFWIVAAFHLALTLSPSEVPQ